jgi:hypothetical protein
VGSGFEIKGGVMATLNPSFHAGKEAAQRMFCLLGRSVKGAKQVRGECDRHTVLVIEQLTISAPNPLVPPTDGSVTVYRINPPVRQIPNEAPEVGRGPLLPASSYPCLGSSYPFWIDDGCHYCA